MKTKKNCKDVLDNNGKHYKYTASKYSHEYYGNTMEEVAKELLEDFPGTKVIYFSEWNYRAGAYVCHSYYGYDSVALKPLNYKHKIKQ